MTKWRTVLVFAMMAAGCAAAAEDVEGMSADEVVRGERDRGRHPAVVALRIGTRALCTGTVVSPTVVLTARHCVSVSTEVVRCDRPWRQVFAELDPSTIAVVAGDDSERGPVIARGRRVIVPPGDRLCGSDVAALVLDRAVRGIAPLAVARNRRLRAGDLLSIVGYGRRGDTPRAGVGERFFRSRVRVVGSLGAEFTTEVGACSGDSGGPAIDRVTGEVVGVLSRGSTRCAAEDSSSVWSHAAIAMPLLEAAGR